MKSNESVENALVVGLAARDLLQALGTNEKGLVRLVLKQVIERLLKHLEKVEKEYS